MLILCKFVMIRWWLYRRRWPSTSVSCTTIDRVCVWVAASRAWKCSAPSMKNQILRISRKLSAGPQCGITLPWHWRFHSCRRFRPICWVVRAAARSTCTVRSSTSSRPTSCIRMRSPLPPIRRWSCTSTTATSVSPIGPSWNDCSDWNNFTSACRS